MTRTRLLAICLAVACTWLVGEPAARAQAGAGEITGVVKDQAGTAVPGATITVTEIRTNLQRVAVSTNDGIYTAASLAPGDYRLDVELAGFKPVRRAGVRLATGEKARIDFDLRVGNVQEQVTVVGDAPIVRAETASLGTVVENEQVVQLPLNGRQFITLAGIVPGVALPPNSLLPASTAADRAPTNISSTAFPSYSRSPGKWRTTRWWTRSRNSRSRATARRPNSGASTAA